MSGQWVQDPSCKSHPLNGPYEELAARLVKSFGFANWQCAKAFEAGVEHGRTMNVSKGRNRYCRANMCLDTDEVHEPTCREFPRNTRNPHAM